jgi:hypothetical protein
MFEPDIVNQGVVTYRQSYVVVCVCLVDRLCGSSLIREELAKDPLKKYRGTGKGVSWEIGKTINAERNRDIDVVNVEEWARKNLTRS